MQGYFVVVSNKNEKFDIKCELHPEYAKTNIPPDQEMLYVEIESTNNVIKSLHNTKEEVKEKYFNKLLSLAQAGLVGETAQPNLAFKSLVKLKDEMILIEGKRIKNDYMKRLGIKAFILIIVILILYIVFHHWKVTYPFAGYCLAFIGALTGTWISFGARKFNITFEQLSLLEEDMMSPWIRLIYIGICSVVFMLFLNTQLISIGIGEISTSIIKTSCELQLSIGVLCGLIESRIGINIYKRAVNILSNE
ncbi:MAG: hypothetical protein WBI07_05840 [Mobilitalea sp.]